MPDKTKKLVRARMAKTGESYQTALRHTKAEAPKLEPPAAQAIFPRPSVDDADRAIHHCDPAVSDAAHAVMDALVVTVARDATPEDKEDVCQALDDLGIALQEVGAHIVGEEGDDCVYEWDLTPDEAKQAKIEREKNRIEELAQSRGERAASERAKTAIRAERKVARAAEPGRFSLADETTGQRIHDLLRGGWMTPEDIADKLDLHLTSVGSYVKREVRRKKLLARPRGDGIDNLYTAPSPEAAAEVEACGRAEAMVREPTYAKA